MITVHSIILATFREKISQVVYYSDSDYKLFLAYTTCIYLKMYLISPLKFCITVVFSFFWDGCKTEMKNKGYAKFWGENKVHYGRCQVAYTCYMFIT